MGGWYGLFNLRIVTVRVWFALLAINQACFQLGLDPANAVPCHWFCSKVLSPVKCVQKVSVLVALKFCLLLRDDVALLVSSDDWHWDRLQPVVMQPWWEAGPLSLMPWFLVWTESLPQVEELMYARVVGEMEVNRWIGAGSSVIGILHCPTWSKRELSCEAELSIFPSFYIPTPTYVYELRAITKRTRSSFSFLCRMFGLCLIWWGDQTSRRGWK